MKNYSFIIPHHNTPDLLQRLIDTIPQRDDIEIIVVDDNSDEDKKAAIMRSDVKTIYIDKEHTKGAGRARNIGMNIATGKWLLFADADDMYKEGFIDILDEYKDDDIEILYFNMDSVDSITLESLTNTKFNRARIVQKIVNEYDGSPKKGDEVRYLSFGPWRKMLLTEFVKKYEMRYEEISRGNDGFFSLQTAYFVKKFKVDKRTVYTNTLRRDSIVYGRTTKERYIDDINRNIHIYRFLKFIGHQDWNIKSIRGWFYFSPFKYFLRRFKLEPLVGIKAFFYYLFHLRVIYKNADLYVKITKKIENKLINNGK